MKTFVIILSFVLIAYVSAFAVPDYDEPGNNLVPLENDGKDDANDDVNDNGELAPVRARRFTCDVFSFNSRWVSPNHAVCATKCLFKGRRGGICRGGRCFCRR